ncbi:hypothetical protein GPECTOR_291g781 [Gonium pectorale]|uniref:Peptidase S54 rhomboid domain-containing protein n=1 Tax=Gonium pectorale TaxID=33097 RepID=A0A150FVX0_GONPE|nr:hypothetical protein GPECTOR_291g781 [Gonium pectorale]|eukprot:KXZ41763.1 hypothetical protein GPECTOR_291g781 [Gonium pectorale]
MGVPLHMQVARHPATSAVTALLVGVWLRLLSGGVAPAAVGMSYQRCVAERQWWRAVAAQVAHLDLLHIVLNVSSLWGLADGAEPAGRAGASADYLRTSCLLLLASAAICLALTRGALSFPALERLRHTTMVGYSCVLFGWMALLAARAPAGHRGGFNLLGLATVPMAAAPFLLLAITQLIIPNASFLGHLSGILAGLLMASGALDWLTPYWTACLAFWAAVAQYAAFTP